MYNYDWDIETGGLVLNTTESKMSKEPRPVYYEELDILGFDRFFLYEKQSEKPYMWSESNKYFYKGELVAHTKGGGYDERPELILDIEITEKLILDPVNLNLMKLKNVERINAIAQYSIKEVYNTYLQYKNKVDIFYVAFSGGKDSVVLLDIVQRAIPHNEFVVVFGDTGMEFSDTYEVVEKTKIFCKNEGIHFIHSKSHKDPMESWKEFGPPASTIRWCCSVHKTAPQIIAIREFLGKADFKGMAFVGVRGDESLRRSNYDYVSDGKKHKGQLSCNAILKWNSAEVYTYMYERDLEINKAYKKGNARAGCLVCPGSTLRNAYIKQVCYEEETEKYLKTIKDVYVDTFKNENKLADFIKNDGWGARKNGRDINLEIPYSEKKSYSDDIEITIFNLDKIWKEWIKTIGSLVNDNSPYIVNYKGDYLNFSLEEIDNKSVIIIDSDVAKRNPTFVKYIKNVFRKASTCTSCRVCEADCPFGNISFENQKVKINDSCISCLQCHKVENGCLVYTSLQQPKGGIIMKDNGSLNRYSTHAPLIDWFTQYFEYKNDFELEQNNSLGKLMLPNFKRFLRDSNLLNQKGFTRTGEIIEEIGLDNDNAWAIMLLNLANTSLINWYVRNVDFDSKTTREYLIMRLEESGLNSRGAKDVTYSLNRILELPFSGVGLGYTEKENSKNITFVRKPWRNVDETIILYGLYKFSEETGNKPDLAAVKKELNDKKILENDVEYVERIIKSTQFSLERLLDYDIESDGISPCEVFGIEKEEMTAILKGLSIKYPEFISVSFTHDLDNITLKKDKTSYDVLELFAQGE